MPAHTNCFSTLKGVAEMSFGQLFVLAVVVTAGVVFVTALAAVQEFQSRKVQRTQPRVFAPAAGLLPEDDDQPREPSPELLYAVRRLG